MKVAIYCRVSTDEQNPEHQEKELLDYCKYKKYEVHKIYTDIISGTKASRIQLDNLIEDAKVRAFDIVIVWKLDRLGRSLDNLIQLSKLFKQLKIGLVFTTQSIDTTTSQGKFFFHVLGAVAELERDFISERTKLSLKGKKNVGKRGKDKAPRSKQGYQLRWRNKT